MRGIRETVLGRVSKNLRQSKLDSVAAALQSGAKVVDIGVWTLMPEPHVAENWLEKQATGKGKLIAIGLGDMCEFQVKYPHVLCIQANGSALPMRDDSVDVAVANAVLEHVRADEQTAFVHEITRVTREWAYLAVPDRWCPMEVHSRTLLIHWLPNWRSLFVKFGQGNWAEEQNLTTIFTKRSLTALLVRGASHAGRWSVRRQKVWGIPVSLLAHFRKEVY